MWATDSCLPPWHMRRRAGAHTRPWRSAHASARASFCSLNSCMPHRYDGQVFVKPPEVLTRDRLLGTYEVKPTLARLKTTLLGTGGVLLLSSSLLFGLLGSKADGDGMYGEGHALRLASHQVLQLLRITEGPPSHGMSREGSGRDAKASCE